MTDAHDDPMAAIAGALGLQASPAPTTAEHHRLLATHHGAVRGIRIPETLVQFLGGCRRHLTRTGMMKDLHAGTVGPIGPEVIEVLVSYARRT
ncbi:MAG: hypothetical protein ACR2M4_11425 [Actinomycetota bacterium]